MTIPKVNTNALAANAEQTGEESDAQLLQHFLIRRDEVAYETLLRRHGPLVMGVCRRVLNDRQEAEDAYQATFLLLAQKASSIRRPERLANWLYGVAYRVSARAKMKVAQSGRCDVDFADPPVSGDQADVAQRELYKVLDEEISRLPAAQRLPLILCYLEGKTHAEAARQLGWSIGSMSRRLSRACETLRRRLSRRGLSYTASVIGFMVAQAQADAAVPETLVDSTRHAAKALVSDGAAVNEVVANSVAEKILDMNRRMLVRRLTWLALLALLLLLLPLGTALSSPPEAEESQPVRLVRQLLDRSSSAEDRENFTATVASYAAPAASSLGRLQSTRWRAAPQPALGACCRPRK